MSGLSWVEFVCNIFGSVHLSVHHQGVFIRCLGSPCGAGVPRSPWEHFVVFHSLTITDNVVMVIWPSLNMACADDCMFWTTFTLGCFALGCFGFLCLAECAVPSLSSFSTLLHLTLQDIAVDGLLAPLARGQRSILVWEFIIAVQCKPWWHISCSGAMPETPCFCFKMVANIWLRQILSVAGVQGIFSSHSFA